MKTLLVSTLVTLLLIILFEVISFNFLPAHYVTKFFEYRRHTSPDVAGLGMYPNGYFIEHEERGFDIGRNRQGQHWVDGIVEGITYPIWSNSLGCFDDKHAEYNRYVYFSGDSYAWGYAPFEQKFGTIIERITGTKILKCGVAHTGQRHQFDKFVEVVKQIGKSPKAIFVFYYSNDIANDYAHPHTTVINGWLVDNVSLGENNELVRHTREELSQRIEDKLNGMKERREKQREWWPRTKITLKYYLVSVNTLIYIKKAIMARTGLAGKQAHSIYRLPSEKNGRYWYMDNPISHENKAALLDFKRFSTENNSEFVVVLIPPKTTITDTNWYAEVRNFLTENEINHIDLTSKFRDKELTSRDMYWVFDGHLNLSGNKIVAEILINEFPYIFRTQHSPN